MYKSTSAMNYLDPKRSQKNNTSKKDVLLKIWKWVKIFLFLFIIISMLWGCVQMYQDAYVVNGIITPASNTKQFAPGVGFELVINFLGGIGGKNDFIYLDSSNNLIEYGFNSITSWGEAFSKTGGSLFYGCFVYPTAVILVGFIRLLSNSLETPLTPGLNSHDQTIFGVASLFGILFTVVIIKLITLSFTWKSQKNQEKMQAMQIKQAEITAKYKDKKDTASRQKQNAEVQALYKKEGLSPFSAFVGGFASMPFLFAIYAIIRSTRVLKDANIGLISLIDQPWEQIKAGNLIYLSLLFVYLPLQICSMLLPTLLQYTKKKSATMTEAQLKARKKQLIMQLVTCAIFILVVANVSSGVCIYWIFSSSFQICQILGFHYFNTRKHSSMSNERRRRLKQQQKIGQNN